MPVSHLVRLSADDAQAQCALFFRIQGLPIALVGDDGGQGHGVLQLIAGGGVVGDEGAVGNLVKRIGDSVAIFCHHVDAHGFIHHA